MHHNIGQMLLVPALLSKNSRFIKNTTTKNGYQAGFLSVIASKWKYICIYTVRSEMYAYHTITEELTFCSALLFKSIVYQYIKGQ